MATIASLTASRSPRGNPAQTWGLVTGVCGLAAVCMAAPPCFAGEADSLERGDQVGNGGRAQHGGRAGGLARQMGSGKGDVPQVTGADLDLAVADVSGQVGQAGKPELAAEQRVAWVGDRDLPFTFLCHQRCITLGGVCQFRCSR